MPRVLVADDSAVARLSVARELRSRGLDVVERESFASAATTDAAELTCALLDLELGDGNGADVADRLRASRSDLPVAFFSSAGDGALVARARAIGPVFTKPDGLVDAVAWIVARAVPSSRGG
jgi:two-component system response regulator RegA